MTESPQKFAFALLFNGKGGARELSEAEVAKWTPADGLLWVDCDLTDIKAKKWLTKESGVNKNMLAILLAGETRPRSIAEDDRLAIVVRGINMNPGAVPDDMVAIRIVMEPSRILTSRRRKVLSVLDVRDTLLAGKGPKTIGSFLTHLTSCLAGRIEAAVENIEALLEKLDADIAGGELVALRTDLGS